MSERNLLSKRVEGLSIIAKQKVSSFLSGNRRSLFLGTGTEFADLREYVFGDDQRYIDWRATAKRQNKIIVRDFEVERNTNVIFLLDISASMLLGKEESRIKAASIAVASLTHASIMNKDFFGFGAFSEGFQEFIPPRGGKSQEFLVYKKLLGLLPAGKTQMAGALKQIATTLTQRSLIIVLSDLHEETDELLKSFRIAKGFNHEVKVVQLTDREEFVLPEKVGKIKFMDPEKKKPVVADFADPITAGIYAYEIGSQRRKLQQFKRKLRGLKIEVVESYTENLVEKVLLAYFTAKQRGM
ncbi:MAG: DUF58 domain-containing protein [Candidatus Kariarchaeaceae archaeon]|jgi:uncharacterized protein (DUF58 family)